MKKKIISIILGIIALFGIMVAEYFVIIFNEIPYCEKSAQTVYIEHFGRVDRYWSGYCWSDEAEELHLELED